MKNLSCVIGALSTMLLLSQDAHSSELKLDPAKSSIEFGFSQLGVPMKGRFTRFDAKVFFDVKKLDATKAEFGVDINSVDLGDKAYNDETKTPVWLNARMFPRATFTADKVTALPGGKFEVTGKLSIKGATQPVRAQFTFADGATPIVEGAFTMKRLGWKIGDNEWKDTSVVADDVTVKFRFTTSR